MILDIYTNIQHSVLQERSCYFVKMSGLAKGQDIQVPRKKKTVPLLLDRLDLDYIYDKKSKACTAVRKMCGLSTVVTPAGASLTMYREIRSYANSIWDDNNNNNMLRPMMAT